MKAALFDLDGTLLDSLGVWADIDRAFLAQRGFEIPADYVSSIRGLSFLQTAQYTKERFHLKESAGASPKYGTKCAGKHIRTA